MSVLLRTVLIAAAIWLINGTQLDVPPHSIPLPESNLLNAGPMGRLFTDKISAWQFGGESSGPLPQWRCLKLANVSDARARVGRWHEGGSHRTTQTCVSNIDLDINVDVRRLR